MNKKSKSFQVTDSGDNTYDSESCYFPGRKGTKLFFKMILMVLPILKNTKKLENIGDMDIGDVVSSLISNMHEDKVCDLVIELCANTVVKTDKKIIDLSKDCDFDVFFAGEYGMLVQVVKNALEVNFSSFFVGKGIKDIFSMIPENVMNKTQS